MKKSTRFVSFILAAMMTMSIFTTLSVTTSADNTTSSVTSAKETSHPEPIHIYEVQKVNGSWKVGPDFRTAFSKDFAYTATKTSLKSVMNKAFKEWVKDNGLKYTYAYVKVFYYDGTITTYKKKASSFSSQTTKPDTTTDSTKTEVDYSYKNTYLYKQLSANQKKWVDWSISGSKSNEPQLSAKDREVAVEVKMRIGFNLKNVKGEKYQKAYKVANKIVSKALKQKTDYNKIKTIHDELCKYAKYGDSHSYVNLLAEGSGDCSAYSSAFAYLCQLVRIDCFRVIGKVDVYKDGAYLAHEWNMIKLDDKWYYVDVTASDKGWKYTFFLKGSATMNKTHKVFVDGIGSLYPTVSKTDYKVK